MHTDAMHKPSPVLPRIIGCCVLVALGMGTEWLLYEYRQQQSAELRANSALLGENIRLRLEGELDTLAATANGMADYWAIRHDAPSPEETGQWLARLHQRSRHVRSIALAVGYRIAYVFPPEGGGQTVGLDYREQAKLWPLIRHGIETHTPMLEGPARPALDLAYRLPIFAGGQFWGLSSFLVDGTTLFSAAGLGRADAQYALRTLESAGEEGATFFGEDRLFDDPEAALTDIAVPGGGWRLAVKSIPPPGSQAWPELARWLGWLLASLFAALAVSVLRLNRELADLALYDRLTGLPSRHLFLDRLKQMIRRTKRNRGQFSVLSVNLDGFKAINERLGTRVGDMMLAGVGKRLLGAIRHCDTVTRWESDEFLILLDACPLEQAGLIAENLRHKVELPVAYGEAELRAGASIGFATFPEDGRSLTALLKVADTRMLKDKSRRKT